MCVVSMVMDHYSDKWQRRLDEFYKPIPVPEPVPLPYIFPPAELPQVPTLTPEEVQEVREWMRRAKEYDERNNEPDCELEEKKERLRRLARELGVKIDFV